MSAARRVRAVGRAVAPPVPRGAARIVVRALLGLSALTSAAAPAAACALVGACARGPADAGPPQAAAGGVAPADAWDDVVAVGPTDARPRPDGTLHGALLEPPFGRVLHGMGQWPEGNAAYLRMLGDPAIAPASDLAFLPVGDWPRSWSSRLDRLRRSLEQTVAEGRLPNLDVSLHGLSPDGRTRQAVDAVIAGGTALDGRLRDVARLVAGLDAPAFVRIGAEFNGAWNGCSPYAYPRAFRRVVELFREEGADRAAFVWCYEPSAPQDFGARDASGAWLWYPGDDVVDWFALDLFDADQFRGDRGRRGVLAPAGRTEAFLRMALEHDKPVLLAEVSAARVDVTPDAEDGRRDWDAFFAPLLAFLDRNPNVMALHYIHVDWSTTGDYGAQGWRDARLDRNEVLAARWRAALADPRFVHRDGRSLLLGAGARAAPAPSGPGPLEQRPP